MVFGSLFLFETITNTSTYGRLVPVLGETEVTPGEPLHRPWGNNFRERGCDAVLKLSAMSEDINICLM